MDSLVGISATGKGRDAFAGHITALKQIIKDAQKQ